MINISLLDETEIPSLKKFSAQEWPGADKEHYGDKEVDFTKIKFAFTARENETMLGYIIAIFDTGVLYIDSLIVAETSRRKGIASELLQAAEEKARSIGAHKAWLETGIDWKAKDFYESKGYQIRTNLNNYYAHQDFVLMDKDL